MKNLWIFLPLALMVLFTSCKEKHEHHEVNIDVVSPAEGMTVSDPSAVNIQVDFSTEEELHDIRIHLRVKGETTEIAPFNPMEVHEHVASTSVSETLDLSSYAAGTTFELEIEACEDHDCEEKEIKTVEFSI